MIEIWVCLKCDSEFEGRQPCPFCGADVSEYSHEEEAEIDFYSDELSYEDFV
jgi:hypothetical protein